MLLAVFPAWPILAQPEPPEVQTSFEQALPEVVGQLSSMAVYLSEDPEVSELAERFVPGSTPLDILFIAEEMRQMVDHQLAVAPEALEQHCAVPTDRPLAVLRDSRCLSVLISEERRLWRQTAELVRMLHEDARESFAQEIDRLVAEEGRTITDRMRSWWRDSAMGALDAMALIGREWMATQGENRNPTEAERIVAALDRVLSEPAIQALANLPAGSDLARELEIIVATQRPAGERLDAAARFAAAHRAEIARRMQTLQPDYCNRFEDNAVPLQERTPSLTQADCQMLWATVTQILDGQGESDQALTAIDHVLARFDDRILALRLLVAKGEAAIEEDSCLGAVSAMAEATGTSEGPLTHERITRAADGISGGFALCLAEIDEIEDMVDRVSWDTIGQQLTQIARTRRPADPEMAVLRLLCGQEEGALIPRLFPGMNITQLPMESLRGRDDFAELFCAAVSQVPSGLRGEEAESLLALALHRALRPLIEQEAPTEEDILRQVQALRATLRDEWPDPATMARTAVTLYLLGEMGPRFSLGWNHGEEFCGSDETRPLSVGFGFSLESVEASGEGAETGLAISASGALLGCATREDDDGRLQRMVRTLVSVEPARFEQPLIIQGGPEVPEMLFADLLTALRTWVRDSVTGPRVVIEEDGLQQLLQFRGTDPFLLSLLFDRSIAGAGDDYAMSVSLTDDGIVELLAELAVLNERVSICLSFPEHDASGECLPGTPDGLPDHLADRLLPILFDRVVDQLPEGASSDVRLEWRRVIGSEALIRVLAYPPQGGPWQDLPRFLSPPGMEWNLNTGDVEVFAPELDWRPTMERALSALPEGWVRLTPVSGEDARECHRQFSQDTGGVSPPTRTAAVFRAQLGSEAPLQGPLGVLCLNTADPRQVLFLPERTGQLATADGTWRFQYRLGTRAQTVEPEGEILLNLRARGQGDLFGSVDSSVALRLDLGSGAWSFPPEDPANRDFYAAIQQQVGRVSPRGVTVHSIGISSEGISFSVDPSGAMHQAGTWLLSQLPEIEPEQWQDAIRNVLDICGEAENAYALATMLLTGQQPDEALCRDGADPLSGPLGLPDGREVDWYCQPVSGDADLLSSCIVSLPMAPPECGERLEFEVTWTDEAEREARRPHVASQEVQDCAARLWDSYAGDLLPPDIRPEFAEILEFAEECHDTPAACAIGVGVSVTTGALLDRLGMNSVSSLPQSCGHVLGVDEPTIGAVVYISLDGSTRIELPGDTSRQALDLCLEDIALGLASASVAGLSDILDNASFNDAVHDIGQGLNDLAEGLGASCDLVPLDPTARIRACNELVPDDLAEARLAQIELSRGLPLLRTNVNLVYVLPMQDLDALLLSFDGDRLAAWVADNRSVVLRCAGREDRECVETLVERLVGNAMPAASTSWIEFGPPDIALTRDRMDLTVPVHASIDILDVHQTIPLSCSIVLSLENPETECGADLRPEALVLARLAEDLNGRLAGESFDLSLLSADITSVSADGARALLVDGTATLAGFPAEEVPLSISFSINGDVDLTVNYDALLSEVESALAGQITEFLDGIAPVRITSADFLFENDLPQGLRLDGEIEIAGMFRISSPSVVLDRHGLRVDGPSQFTIGFPPGTALPAGPVMICPTGGTISEERLSVFADVTLFECNSVGAILVLKGEVGVQVDPLALSAEGSLRVLSILDLGHAVAELDLTRPSLLLQAELGGDLSDVFLIQAMVDITPPTLDANGDISVFRTSIGDGTVHLDMERQLINADTRFDIGFAAGSGSFVTGPGFSRPTALAEAQYQIGGFPVLGGDLEARMRYARVGVRFMGLNLAVAFPGLDVLDPSRIDDMLKDLLRLDLENLDEALEALLSGNITINPFAGFGAGGDGLGDDGDSDAEGDGREGGDGTGNQGGEPAQGEGNAAELGPLADSQGPPTGGDTGLIGTERAEIAFRQEGDTVVIAFADAEGGLIARAAMEDGHFTTGDGGLRQAGSILAVSEGYFSQLLSHDTLSTGVDGCPESGSVVHLYGGEVVTDQPNVPVPGAVSRGHYELCRVAGPNGRLTPEALAAFDDDMRRDLAALNQALAMEMLHRPGSGLAGPRDQGLLFETGRMISRPNLRGAAVQLRAGQAMIVARARIADTDQAVCGAGVLLDPDADWQGPRAFLVNGVTLNADISDARLQELVAAMWGCEPGTLARAAEDILAAGSTLSEREAGGGFTAIASVPEAFDVSDAGPSWLSRFEQEQAPPPPALPEDALEELEEIAPAASVVTECVGDCVPASVSYLVSDIGGGRCEIRRYGIASGWFPAGAFATGCGLGGARIVRSGNGRTLLVGAPDEANESEYVVATSDGLRRLAPRLPDLGHPEVPQAIALAVGNEVMEILSWDELIADGHRIARQGYDGQDRIALYNGDPSGEVWSVAWDGQAYTVVVQGGSTTADRTGLIDLMAPGTEELTFLPDGYLLRRATERSDLYQRREGGWSRIGRVASGNIAEVLSLVNAADLPDLEPGQERDLFSVRLPSGRALSVREDGGQGVRFWGSRAAEEAAPQERDVTDQVDHLGQVGQIQRVTSAGEFVIFSVPSHDSADVVVLVRLGDARDRVDVCIFDDQMNLAGHQSQRGASVTAFAPESRTAGVYYGFIYSDWGQQLSIRYWFTEGMDFDGTSATSNCRDWFSSDDFRADLSDYVFGSADTQAAQTLAEIIERAADGLDLEELSVEALAALAERLLARVDPPDTEVFLSGGVAFLAETAGPGATEILRHEGQSFVPQTQVIHGAVRPETGILRDISALDERPEEVTLLPLDLGDGLFATAMQRTEGEDETGRTMVWIRRDARLHRLEVRIPNPEAGEDLLRAVVGYMVREGRDEVDVLSSAPLVVLSGNGTCRLGQGQRCPRDLVFLDGSNGRLPLLLSHPLRRAMLDYILHLGRAGDLPETSIPTPVYTGVNGDRAIVQFDPRGAAVLVEDAQSDGTAVMCLTGQASPIPSGTMQRLLDGVPSDLLSNDAAAPGCGTAWSIEEGPQQNLLIWRRAGDTLSVHWLRNEAGRLDLPGMTAFSDDDIAAILGHHARSLNIARPFPGLDLLDGGDVLATATGEDGETWVIGHIDAQGRFCRIGPVSLVLPDGFDLDRHRREIASRLVSAFGSCTGPSQVELSPSITPSGRLHLWQEVPGGEPPADPVPDPEPGPEEAGLERRGWIQVAQLGPPDQDLLHLAQMQTGAAQGEPTYRAYRSFGEHNVLEIRLDSRFFAGRLAARADRQVSTLLGRALVAFDRLPEGAPSLYHRRLIFDCLPAVGSCSALRARFSPGWSMAVTVPVSTDDLTLSLVNHSSLDDHGLDEILGSGRLHGCLSAPGDDALAEIPVLDVWMASAGTTLIADRQTGRIHHLPVVGECAALGDLRPHSEMQAPLWQAVLTALSEGPDGFVFAMDAQQDVAAVLGRQGSDGYWRWRTFGAAGLPGRQITADRAEPTDEEAQAILALANQMLGIHGEIRVFGSGGQYLGMSFSPGVSGPLELLSLFFRDGVADTPVFHDLRQSCLATRAVFEHLGDALLSSGVADGLFPVGIAGCGTDMLVMHGATDGLSVGATENGGVVLRHPGRDRIGGEVASALIAEAVEDALVIPAAEGADGVFAHATRATGREAALFAIPGSDGGTERLGDLTRLSDGVSPEVMAALFLQVLGGPEGRRFWLRSSGDLAMLLEGDAAQDAGNGWLASVTPTHVLSFELQESVGWIPDTLAGTLMEFATRTGVTRVQVFGDGADRVVLARSSTNAYTHLGIGLDLGWLDFPNPLDTRWQEDLLLLGRAVMADGMTPYVVQTEAETMAICGVMDGVHRLFGSVGGDTDVLRLERLGGGSLCQPPAGLRKLVDVDRILDGSETAAQEVALVRSVNGRWTHLLVPRRGRMADLVTVDGQQVCTGLPWGHPARDSAVEELAASNSRCQAVSSTDERIAAVYEDAGRLMSAQGVRSFTVFEETQGAVANREEMADMLSRPAIIPISEGCAEDFQVIRSDAGLVVFDPCETIILASTDGRNVIADWIFEDRRSVDGPGAMSFVRILADLQGVSQPVAVAPVEISGNAGMSWLIRRSRNEPVEVILLTGDTVCVQLRAPNPETARWAVELAGFEAVLDAAGVGGEVQVSRHLPDGILGLRQRDGSTCDDWPNWPGLDAMVPSRVFLSGDGGQGWAETTLETPEFFAPLLGALDDPIIEELLDYWRTGASASVWQDQRHHWRFILRSDGGVRMRLTSHRDCVQMPETEVLELLRSVALTPVSADDWIESLMEERRADPLWFSPGYQTDPRVALSPGGGASDCTTGRLN